MDLTFFIFYFVYLCIAKENGTIKEKALSTDLCHVWGHLFLCAYWQMWGSWCEWMAPDITDMRPEEPLGPVGEVKKEGLNCFNQEVPHPHSDMPIEESVVTNERYLRFHLHQMNKIMWFNTFNHIYRINVHLFHGLMFLLEWIREFQTTWCFSV